MSGFLNSISEPINYLFTAIVNSIPKLVIIFIIAVITRYFLKLLKYAAEKLEASTNKEWYTPAYKVIRFFVLVYMFIIIYPYIPGSGRAAFLPVVGIAGLIIAIGSYSFINNALAGLAIAFSAPFKKGDRIKCGNMTGDVTEKQLLTTKVRTIKNEDVLIPNSMIMTGGVLNFSSSAKNLGLIVHSEITVSYDVPWKTVHAILIEAAKATKGILETPEPFVLQKSLDDFYACYEINAYTEKANLQASIYSELHQNIQNKFSVNGVDLTSPHYRAGGSNF